MSRYKPIDTKQSLSMCSEYSGPISSTLHNNLITEAEFCNFYAIILQELFQKIQTEYGLICKALHSIRTYREPNKPPRLPNYEKEDSRFAYVFSYSIIHSVLMYDRFRKMMIKKPPMLKKIFSVSELNICILGGGPCFEAAAISKFLKKAIAIFKPDAKSQLLIHITAVDICSEWETVVECLFTTLQKDLHPVIEIDFCFVHADLTEELTPVVTQAIESSYMVLMFKFVSEVFDRCGSEKVEKMIKGILHVMSFESCLFFLDNAGGGNFRIVEETINNIPCSTRFYGPKLHHCQELTEDTVEKYYFFVQDIFQTLKCTCKTTISCSAWLKIDPVEQDIDSSAPKEADVKKMKKKEKKKLKKSCNENDIVEQDINSSSVQRNTDIKNNQKKEKKKPKKEKSKSSVEQDINCSSIQKNTDVKNNQKKEKKLKKSCSENGSVEQHSNSSSVQRNTDVKNSQKKERKKAEELQGESFVS